MHYFAPPVQAALCLILKKVVCGKLEAILEARRLFPEISVFDELIHVLDEHYELPHLFREPDMSDLEFRLFDALKFLGARLSDCITVISPAPGTTPVGWPVLLKGYVPDPKLKVFDNSKWARQMKGRLYFYAHAPVHFDSTLCIGVELNRIHDMFYAVPFKTYWELKTGDSEADLPEIVESLRGDCLTDSQADATLTFGSLTWRKWQPSDYKKAALEVVAVYEEFYRGLHNLSSHLSTLVR
jgi:hypothetical protein